MGMSAKKGTWPAAVSALLIVVGFVVSSNLSLTQQSEARFATSEEFVAAVDTLFNSDDYRQAEALCSEVLASRQGIHPPRWLVSLHKARAVVAQGRLSEGEALLSDVDHLWREKYWWATPESRGILESVARSLADSYLAGDDSEKAVQALSLGCMAHDDSLGLLQEFAQEYAQDPRFAESWSDGAYAVVDDFEGNPLHLPQLWTIDADVKSTVLQASDESFRGANSARISFSEPGSGRRRWYGVPVWIKVGEGDFAIRARVKASGLKGDELQATLWFPQSETSRTVISSHLEEVGQDWFELQITGDDLVQSLTKAKKSGIDVEDCHIVKIGIRGDRLSRDVYLDAIDVFLPLP